MSERDGYPHGVPCWVEALVPDPGAARAFYAGVFGWEFSAPGAMPGEAAESATYYVARLRDRDIAGVAMLPDAAAGPGWMTQVRTESAEASAAAARDAGGRVLAGPLEIPPVGRMAVIADPAGAVFAAWEPSLREGAQLVNEPSAWSMSMLTTPSPEVAAEFYEAVFGWHAESFGPGIWMLRLPGFVGGEPSQPVPRDVVAVLGQGEDSEAVWSVDFWIADVEAAAAAAGELGGEVLEPPSPQPGAPFVSATLADPSGARFSISELALDD